jgi:hypothetical protein
MKLLRWCSILLGACSSVPTPAAEETLIVPGTNLRLEMVYVPGTEKVRPFWISKREVTWGEFDRFYQSPDEQRWTASPVPPAARTTSS